MQITRVSLLLTALSSCGVAGAAETAPATPPYESFEGETTGAWKSTSAPQSLVLSKDRYKSGHHSLLWQWTGAKDALEMKNPSAFKLKGKNMGFTFWVYNEEPTTSPMRAELLRGDEVVASCWFWMDYRGWAPLGATYQELGCKPDTTIDGIRIHPPERLKKGRLFFDVAQFDLSGLRADGSYQMPWRGVPDGLKQPVASIALSASSPTLNRPWLPARKTANEAAKADMKTLSSRLLPALSRPGKGLQQKELDGIRATFASYEIHRTEGRLTGRPIDDGSMLPPTDAINYWDYLKFCDAVQRAFSRAGDPTQVTELKQMFVDLSVHLLDQGWREGSNLKRFNNYPGASANAFLLMRDVLEEAGLASDIARSLAWTKGGQGDGDYLQKSSFASMDGLGFWTNELVPFLLMIPDDTERLHRLNCAKRYIDLALVNPHTIAPDGCSYHHGAFHFAYASYNLPRLVRVLVQLRDTRFRLDATAHERLRTYAKAIAFTFSAGVQPYNLAARPGTPLHGNMGDFASLLATLGTPDGKKAIDPDMVDLACSQYLDMGANKQLDKEPMKIWLAEGGKTSPITGHMALNGSPLAVHRRPRWLVGIAGMSKYWRGIEIYGWTQQNNYSRFARNGSICVVANGQPPNLAESGWRYEGWNWSHFPGTTALQLSPIDLFDGYAMYGNGSGVVGGTSMDGNGTWGMDYTGGNGVTFKRSVFSFDNRLTVLTSNISSSQQVPAVTTLFQNHLQPGHDKVVLEDGTSLKLPSKQRLESSGIRWIIDNQGQGYLLPANQPALQVQCQPQSWTYMVSKYLKDPKQNPFPSNNEYRFWNRRGKDMAKLESHYNPTTGDFALAYFDHGTAPKDAACAYTIVIGANEAVMTQMATTPPYELLQQDAHVHAIRDIASDTTGYTLFTENSSIAAKGLIRANDQPCFLMVRRNGENIRLSIVAPDIERKKPVTLTLEGAWQTSTKSPSLKCKVSGGNTHIEVQPEYYMPFEFTLRPSS